MSTFKTLKEDSNNFERELRELSSELISAKIGDTFDDVVSKRLESLSLFSAKLKLLRAKVLSLTPQITNHTKSDKIIYEYGDTAAVKLLENITVKCLTQTNAVKKLISTPDQQLDPELVTRKRNIVDALQEYKQSESSLHRLDMTLQEKQYEMNLLRTEWDTVLGELRDIKSNVSNDDEMDTDSPSYVRLQNLVSKMEMIRWLITQLVVCRKKTKVDPKRSLQALKMTRQCLDVEYFMSN